MMTGYIEAIEARLHRMEGLLGGLVKDKDPRAEIVRAELDAMAREAEMTGLKLRRSKAYEEINHRQRVSGRSQEQQEDRDHLPDLPTRVCLRRNNRHSISIHTNFSAMHHLQHQDFIYLLVIP
ncbi:hypothetical protein EDD11_004649 [Mortierella claussenii]|nr:hypothetical protein EDD11_004649 [Mortierella claussenii]